MKDPVQQNVDDTAHQNMEENAIQIIEENIKSANPVSVLHIKQEPEDAPVFEFVSVDFLSASNLGCAPPQKQRKRSAPEEQKSNSDNDTGTKRRSKRQRREVNYSEELMCSAPVPEELLRSTQPQDEIPKDPVFVSSENVMVTRTPPPLQKVNYKCEFCEDAFQRKHDLLRHKCLKIPACKLCSKRVDTYRSLKQHILSHDDMMPYGCSQCTKCFCKISMFKNHLHTHNKDIPKPWMCCFCHVKFVTVGSLQLHMLDVHYYKVPRAVKRHQNISTDIEEDEEIPVIKTEIEDTESLQDETALSLIKVEPDIIEHDNVEDDSYEINPLMVPDFQVESTLEDMKGNIDINHMSLEINEDQTASAETSGYSCVICNQIYTDPTNVCWHISGYPNINLATVKTELAAGAVLTVNPEHVLQPQPPVTKRHYKCPECIYICFTPDALNTHIRDHRTKAYSCKICGKRFNNPVSIKRHRLLHSGVKNFACTLCSEKFWTYGGCYSHMLKKHNTRYSFVSPASVNMLEKSPVSRQQYQCMECVFSCRQMETLDKHSEEHRTKPFGCDQCGKRFGDESKLKNHEVVHSGVKRFSCTVCSKEFFSYGACYSHMLKKHNTRYSFSTPEVERTVRSPSSSFKKSYNCTLCVYVCSNKDTLTKHTIEHETKQFSCEKCGKRFLSKANMKSHELIHSEVKRFSCTICNENFVTYDGCYNHMLRKHNTRFSSVTLTSSQRIQKPYKCGECVYSCQSSEALEKHIEDHKTKPFACEKCGKRFGDKRKVKNHEFIHSGIKRFSCFVCSQRFMTYDGYYTHMAKSHNMKLKPYKCTECIFACRKEDTLAKHMEDHVTKQFACEKCGLRFIEEEKLKNHEVIHSGIKTFSCRICDEKFLSYTGCNKHMLKMHNTTLKPYKCEQCIFTCLRKDTLDNHTSEHETKLFACEKCGKRFTEEPELMNHDYIHSIIKKFGCTMCGEKFVTKTRRNKHMLEIHNTSVKPFKCEECIFSCHKRETLEKHSEDHKTKQYACQKCGRRFTEQTDLKSHEFIHAGIKKFACTVCGEKFLTKTSCSRHMMEAHKKTMKPFKCEECIFSCHKRESLDKHYEDHKTKQFSCEICGRRFDEETELKNHEYIHAGIKRFACTECDEKFLTKTSCNNHMLKFHHIRLKPFKCTECNFSCHKSDTLENHIEEHRTKQFACDKCGKRFDDETKMQNHEYVHMRVKRYSCAECGESFVTYDGYYNHMLKKHETKVCAQKPEKPYKCLECIYSCQTSEALEKHTEDHKTKKYACEKCGKRFSDMRKVKNHEPVHSGIKNFSCTVCNQTFLTYDGCYTHMVKVHKMKSKPFKCSDCIFSCRKEDTLEKHLEDHKTKPYSCEICGLRFIEEEKLKNHEVIHSGIKTFSCTICSEKFLSYSGCNRHMMKMHNTTLKPYKCGECVFACLRKETLERHSEDHQTKAFGCVQCGKRFEDEEELRNHDYIHAGIKRFSCTVCDEKFLTKTSCNNHMLKMHNTSLKPFKCGACNFSCHKGETLENHIEEHKTKEFGCEKCGKRFSDKWKLRNHKPVHSRVKRFSCTECDESFATYNGCYSHMRSKHNTRFSSVTDAGNDDSRKPFKCAECIYSCQSNDALEKHYEDHKTKAFACETCGRRFADKRKVKNHEYIHSGIKRFSCTVCSQTFMTYESCYTHMVKKHRMKLKPFKCTECIFSCRKEDTLAKHMDDHRTKQFPCEKCGLRFSEEEKLKNHEYIHSGIKTFSCTVCSEKFVSYTGCNRHMMKMHNTTLKPYKCEECVFTCLRKDTLDRHTEDHQTKPFGCIQCGKRFEDEEELKNHDYIHAGVKRFSCTVCDEKFLTKTSCNNHMLKVHKTRLKPFKCGACNFSCHKGETLENHIEEHKTKEFGCEKCGKRFSDKWKLRNHKLVHAGIKRFACTECDKKFVSYEGCYNHMLSKHNTRFSSVAETSNQDSRKPFKCSQCIYSCQNSDVLEKHYEDHNTKNFACETCGRRFSDKRKVKNHEYVHSGIKRFSCTTCSQKFLTYEGCYTHMVKFHNTKLKPYKCTECIFSCRKKDTLEKHLEDHKDKEFACEICGMRFSDEGKMKNHEFVHSGVKRFTCTVCSEKFLTYCGCYSHMLKKHNIRYSFSSPSGSSMGKSSSNKFKCTECIFSCWGKQTLDKHSEDHQTKPFPCEKCGKRFIDEVELKHHDYIHAGIKRFACTVCNEKFLTFTSCNRHMLQTHHKRLKRFKCDECIFSCHMSDTLEKHAEDHKTKHFACQRCGKRFAEDAELKNHEFIHTGIKRFSCTVCNEKFLTKTGCNSHMYKVHSKRLRPFKCEECIFSCHKSETLEKHVEDHRTKQFSCETCGKRFTDEIELKNHEFIHSGIKRFSCTLCGEEFLTHTSYNRHMTKVHNTRLKAYKCSECVFSCHKSEILEKHSEEHTTKPFACERCGKRFSDETELNSHAVVHSGIMNFSCTICSEKFLTEAGFTSHMTKVHPSKLKRYKCTECIFSCHKSDTLDKHSQEHLTKPFGCQTCGRRFAEQFELENHEIIHSGLMRFSCTICGEKFLTKTSCNSHMHKIHNAGLKPFQCSECIFSCHKSETLEKHYEEHTTKPFGCPTCGKRFPDEGKKQKHEFVHSGVKRFSCTICNDKFLSYSGCYTHMLAVHNTRYRVQESEN